LDTESLANLLSFLPRFERGEFATASEHYRSTGRYIGVVEELIRAISSSDLLLEFDWTTWKDASRYSRDPSLVRTADFETVRRVLTTIVRQDRFVGGLVPRMCSSGIMKALLERLEEISHSR
jgi:hypothetical protein